METRFIPQENVSELMNLWHTSRISHSGRHDRLIQTLDWYIEEFGSTVSRGKVYKDLCSLVEV